jgi:hypothetical protein
VTRYKLRKRIVFVFVCIQYILYVCVCICKSDIEEALGRAVLFEIGWSGWWAV